MNDLISRKALIAEYDRVHIGPPGGARKLMEDAPAVQQWIPVEEGLPESYVNVIVCRCDGVNRSVGVEYVTLCDDWSKDYLSLATSVTHWMPMPEPPKEG